MTEEMQNNNDLKNLETEDKNEVVEDSLNDEIKDDKSIIIEELNKQIEEKTKECQEYLELARRTKAEFENFRKRTQKEKETIYDDGFADAIKELLPVLDNLERALDSTKDETPLYQGVEMTLKIFKDTLSKVGVSEIPALNEKFDPHFHNAVMHIEDESYEENTIIEVFQKGYKYKDKILRYSMVKVAN